MSKKVVRTRASGNHSQVLLPTSGGTRRALEVQGRKASPGACVHTLAAHETVVDKGGRETTVSYSRACVVKHTKMHNGKKWVNAQPHKDSTGREWE